jgi:hypothetical protein
MRMAVGLLDRLIKLHRHRAKLYQATVSGW